MNNLNILYNEMMDFQDNLESDLFGVPLSNNHMLGPMSQRGPFCNYYPVFFLNISHWRLQVSWKAPKDEFPHQKVIWKSIGTHDQEYFKFWADLKNI